MTAENSALLSEFAGIAETGYEGWVAWLADGTAIFESRVPNPRLVQLMADAARSSYDSAVRLPGRQVMDWKELPHERIKRVAIYCFQGYYTEQPVMVIERPPGLVAMRFIQMKSRGLQIPSGAGELKDSIDHGPRRTYAQFYLGYWDPNEGTYGRTVLVQVTRQARLERKAMHPCWPRPHGFALGPHVVGLTEEQVPECPFSPVPAALEQWTRVDGAVEAGPR